ncbi:MAG: hypothetical protein ABSB36_09215 [Candidatus Dormibacteria bacterium]|jgi:ABC-2 type transport system permease protein
MTVWRLEIARLWRTRRLVALLGVFLVLGFGEPVLTYYLPQLVNGETNGIKIVIPPATPAQALKGFSQNAAQLGILVVVIVAAASVALDARPALASFYRTRIRCPSLLILPRATAVAVASVVGLVLGSAAAWYETRVLIGYLSPARLAAGCGLEALWLVFSVVVVTTWATLVRSVLAVAGWSLATLLVLALLDSITAVAPWAPTALASGIQDLLPGGGGVPWRAVAVTAAATALLLAVATRLARSRRSDR